MLIIVTYANQKDNHTVLLFCMESSAVSVETQSCTSVVINFTSSTLSTFNLQTFVNFLLDMLLRKHTYSYSSEIRSGYTSTPSYFPQLSNRHYCYWLLYQKGASVCGM